MCAERLVAAGERANFFFDQGELLLKRRKMAFKAYANRLQGGVLDPACLGLDHVLEFGAPSHQGAKRSLLGPWRLVKLKNGLSRPYSAIKAASIGSLFACRPRNLA